MSNRLPNDLINSLKQDPSFDWQAFVAIHNKEEKTNSIRLNPLKTFDNSHLEIDTVVPWCRDGFYLKERPIFTLDPFFHGGCYYSQEASSMFLSYTIEQIKLHEKPIKALDLCAAPGGKSTLLVSSLHADSLLVSNEIIKSRANVLSENLTRWGYPNVVVTNNDPSAFGHLPGYFDLMVVDAPCSGSGMFHKNHTTMDTWSLANVKLCSERQRRILANSLSSLSEDGILFYSTCSYSKEENEENIDWLVGEFGMESLSIPISEKWGIQYTETSLHKASCYRFYPHKVEGEGFFFAVLRKKQKQDSFLLKRLKIDTSNAPQHIAKDWLDMDGLYTFQYHDDLHVFSEKYKQDLKALQYVLYLKNAGTVIGRYMNKLLVPSHDLAMSVRVRKDLLQIDLDLNDALKYLHKDRLDSAINKENLRGWVLVTYQGTNLGWVKVMPNRINNYYPTEARIVVL